MSHTSRLLRNTPVKTKPMNVPLQLNFNILLSQPRENGRTQKTKTTRLKTIARFDLLISNFILTLKRLSHTNSNYSHYLFSASQVKWDNRQKIKQAFTLPHALCNSSNRDRNIVIVSIDNDLTDPMFSTSMFFIALTIDTAMTHSQTSSRLRPFHDFCSPRTE